MPPRKVVVRIKTGFAGTLEIDQDQITSISTDGPVNVALPDGNTVSGRIQTTPSGVRVTTGAGALQTFDPRDFKYLARWRSNSGQPYLGL